MHAYVRILENVLTMLTLPYIHKYATPSVCQRMIEIFHTLAYAGTIRDSMTGPLRKILHHAINSWIVRGMVPRFLNRHLTI
jgi:hypothetical protein